MMCDGEPLAPEGNQVNVIVRQLYRTQQWCELVLSFNETQSNNTQPTDDISVVVKTSPWRSNYLTIIGSLPLAAATGLPLPLWPGSLTHHSTISEILATIGLVILVLR